jgi:hypothetical protein
MPYHRKVLKLVAKHCPLVYGQLYAKKYHLPADRQGEYDSLELDNWMSFERMFRWACGDWNMADEVANCALWSLAGEMHYDRPTLFLERELAEALLRTDILADIDTEDVKWRWPAFRVVLPRNLIAIDRPPKGLLYLTHFDVCHVKPGEPVQFPATLADEVDRFHSFMKGTENLGLMRKGKFMYKPDEEGIGMSAALNEPENDFVHQTIYGAALPWGSAVRLQECAGITGDLNSPMQQDDADKRLLKRLEHLVFNVLLFMSAEPVEYTPEKTVRRERFHELQPALVEARFVGRSQYHFRSTPAGPRGEPTGRSLAPHWVCGAWRRVPHGPLNVSPRPRKLTWIKPYATGTLRETASTALGES